MRADLIFYVLEIVLSLTIASAASGDHKGYDLPAFATTAVALSEEARRTIPMDIYIAAKNKRLHPHNQELLNRNSEFKPHVYTDGEL